MIARIIIAALFLGLIAFAAAHSAQAHGNHSCHRHGTAWHCK